MSFRAVVMACGLGLVLALGAAVEAAIEPKEGQILLFNGVDFTGWRRFLPDGENPDLTWRVLEGGVVHCTGKPMGYMRTEQGYQNYRLTMEWRWPRAGGNSGLLVHVQEEDKVWPRSIEVQLGAEDAGDFWVIGGTTFREHIDPERRRVGKMTASTEKPLGEWNALEVICVEETIEVFVNGVLQNRATQATVNAGYIALQSEGAPIEFRNLTLYPLAREAAPGEAGEGEGTPSESN